MNQSAGTLPSMRSGKSEGCAINGQCQPPMAASLFIAAHMSSVGPRAEVRIQVDLILLRHNPSGLTNALSATTLIVPAMAATDDEEAVKQAVEALRKAMLTQDKAKLETLTAEQLSYSHSDARLEDKAKFINAIMTRKAVFKSLDFPDLTVAIVGNNAIVRHLWVSESELDGKVTNTKIGVLQVWLKQDSSWKLLARASFKLPEPVEKS